jgi:hypothetical protein
MRARIACSMAVVVLMTCAAALASGASAAPRTADEFRSELSTAVAASGVFESGTTVVVQVSDQGGDHWGTWVTNPDGSLRWHEVTPEGSYDLRCVRVDRCWERSDIDFIDRKWHRVPTGTVAYRLASTAWSVVLDDMWTYATQFDVASDAAGTQYFTALESYSDADPDTGEVVDVVLAHTITVRERQASYRFSVAVDDAAHITMFLVGFRSQLQPVVVRAPLPSKVGARVLQADPWVVEINN